MRLGIILVVIGLIALFSNAGWLSGYAISIIWPIAFIVVGTWIIVRRRSCKHCDCHAGCDHKNGVCKVDDSK